MIVYDFAEEFSKIPGPGREKIGPYSGELFREQVLKKWFNKNQEVEIDIDGVVMNFGPSFLSEAFGKMAKYIGSEEKFFNIIHVKNNSDKNKHFEDLLHKYVRRSL
tara:strand:+ start:1958 stop:2275 length:318 start_codon:yes stop_codon:yes gene_type:complete